MKSRREYPKTRGWLISAGCSIAAIMSFAPSKALACAACFGQSDSAMAKGFNWGVFSLLAVVVVVLGTIAGFFVYLARRAALYQPSATGANAGLTAASGPGPVPAASH